MEFSKTAILVNTMVKNSELDVVDVNIGPGDDDIVTCAIMVVLTVKDKDYIVLLPLDESGQNHDGHVWIYGFVWHGEDQEPELLNIADDDEYMEVSEAFSCYLDDVEFDELVEVPEEGLDGEVEPKDK